MELLKKYFMPDPPGEGEEEEQPPVDDGVGGSPRDRNGEEEPIEEPEPVGEPEEEPEEDGE